MEIFVEEIGTTPNSTASQMFVNGKPFCFVLEDGFRDVKIPGETRIAGGRYKVKKRTYGKFYELYKKKYGHKFAIELEGVQDFTDILVHIGCFVRDTRGCNLTNTFIGIGPTGDYEGRESEKAYLKLYSAIEKAFDVGQEVWYEISRRPVVDEGFAG